MKFEVMRDRLLEALNDVMKAVSSKTTVAILTGIKIEAKKEGIEMKEIMIRKATMEEANSVEYRLSWIIDTLLNLKRTRL